MLIEVEDEEDLVDIRIQAWLDLPAPIEEQQEPARPEFIPAILGNIFGKVRGVAREIKSAAKDTATLTKEIIKEKAQQALPMAVPLLFTPNMVAA